MTLDDIVARHMSGGMDCDIGLKQRIKNACVEYADHCEYLLMEKILAEQNRVIWRAGDGIDWEDGPEEILNKLKIKE